MNHDQAKAAIDRLRITEKEKAAFLKQWDERALNVRAVVSVIARRQANNQNIHNGEPNTL